MLTHDYLKIGNMSPAELAVVQAMEVVYEHENDGEVIVDTGKMQTLDDDFKIAMHKA